MDAARPPAGTALDAAVGPSAVVASASAAPRAPAARPAARRPAGLKGWLLHPAAKALLFGVCLLPFCWLFWRAYANLRFLCITLAVTPLRQWSGLPALARFRRMLGLFTFFYVVLHFLSYAWLDMGLDPQAIAKDIPKRPFALVGFLSFLLLIPLAATSFNKAIKRLGAKGQESDDVSGLFVQDLADLRASG